MVSIGGGGVSEELLERLKEVYENTANRVRVGGKMGRGMFWTARRVRQRCPLSAKLFTLLVADSDKRMEKREKGGIEIKRRRLFALAYADELVILAREKWGMKFMMKQLREYLWEKGLEANQEKSKIMRFGKRVKSGKKGEWKWGERMIKEVRKYRYLGFIFQRNGGIERHVGERVRKAGGVMREVWEIGKRWFGEDVRRRFWLFDMLVWTVMGYGVEIWGWRERERIERVQERYGRWVLGLDWETPGSMLREELKMDKLRLRGAKRAWWKYEERLREGKGSEWARRCLEEIRRGNK